MSHSLIEAQTAELFAPLFCVTNYPLVISLWLLVDSLTGLMNAILLASSNLIR